MKYKLFMGVILTFLFLGSCYVDTGNTNISRSITDAKAKHVFISKYHVLSYDTLKKNNYDLHITQIWEEKLWEYQYYCFIIPKVVMLKGPPNIICNFNSPYLEKNSDYFYFFMTYAPDDYGSLDIGNDSLNQIYAMGNYPYPDTIDMILVRKKESDNGNSDTTWMEKIRIAKDKNR